MCGCKFKAGSAESLKDMAVVLDANDVAAYRTKDIMLCIYSASPSKFQAAYSGIMINGSKLSDEIVSGQEVIYLAKLHDQGMDKKQFNVDFLKIAQGIKHNQAELDAASCTIGLKK